jgi:hypothetical protein
MDSSQIEARLRLPAHDEPSVLPPLVLPRGEGSIRVRWRMEPSGGGAARGFSGMPAALAVLLLLALATVAALVVGAIHPRLPGQPDALHGYTNDGIPFDVSFEWPGDWQRLVEGDFWVEDGSEPGVQGASIVLVAASTGLTGCDDVTPVPTLPPPIAVPSGEPAPPLPSIPPGAGGPDARMTCFRSVPLPPNTVRLTAIGGSLPSSPTELAPATGWTDTVDGSPALLEIRTGAQVDAPGVDEVRTWTVLVPGRLGSVVRLRADLAGPDLEAERAAVERIVASLRFDHRPPPIDLATRDAAITTALNNRDRDARENNLSEFYGCFPRKAGSRDVAIVDGPASPLPAAVPVTCTTAVAATEFSLWRITLTVTWEAGDGYPAGEWAEALYANGNGTSDAEQLLVGDWEGLPHARVAPPPLLDGPLAIPPGSIVEILPPGALITESPAADASTGAGPLFRQHLYVVSGPEMHDGVEWYLVQYSTSRSAPPGLGWIPGTAEGRPLLALVEPACPTGGPGVADLLRLTPAERLACFGGSELTLGPVMLRKTDPMLPPDGTPLWLAGDTAWQLFGSDGPDGAQGALRVHPAEGLGSIPTDTWLTVRGHFDDPASATCERSLTGTGWGGPAEDLPEVQVLRCRESFVITSFERTSAP